MLRHPRDARLARPHWPRLVAGALVSALAILTVNAFAQTAKPSSGAEMLVYIGTYTTEKSKGIYVSRLDLASGALTPPELAAETPNPSFLAVHPSGDFLYAANEVRALNDQPGGGVSGFAVDRKTGKLTPLNQQSSRGSGAVYLVVDKAGRNVLVSNYGEEAWPCCRSKRMAS